MALLTKRSLVGAVVLVLFPTAAFAAPQTYADLINLFVGFIKLLIPIIGGMAVLVFFWGLGTFIFSAGDTSAHEKGRRIMIWGLVALFAMLSIYGLVSFAGNLIFGDSFFNYSAPADTTPITNYVGSGPGTF